MEVTTSELIFMNNVVAGSIKSSTRKESGAEFITDTAQKEELVLTRKHQLLDAEIGGEEIL